MSPLLQLKFFRTLCCGLTIFMAVAMIWLSYQRGELEVNMLGGVMHWMANSFLVHILVVSQRSRDIQARREKGERPNG